MANDIEAIVYPEYIAQVRLRFPLGALIISPIRLNDVLVLRQEGQQTRELGSVGKSAGGSWRSLNISDALARNGTPVVTYHDDAGIVTYFAELFIRKASLSGHQTLQFMESLAHSSPSLAPRATDEDVVRQILFRKALPANDGRLQRNG